MDWFVLDKNADTTALVAGGTHLYQLHKTGKIWQYTGTPLTGWQMLDNNADTKAIAAFNASLCQLHSSGLIWFYAGTPLTGWDPLGANESAVVLEMGVGQPLAAPSNVPSGFYALKSDGTILEWGEIIF